MLYPGFIALSAVVLAITAIGIARLVRAPSATGQAAATSSWRRFVSLAYRGYVDVVVPAAIILFVPGYFGTDWSVMARIDIGQVLLAIAGLRILDGAMRVGRWLPVSLPAAGKGRVLTSA
jgi:hypothetical protein